MKQLRDIIGLVIFFCSMSFAEQAVVHPQLKAFPAARAGMVRYVIVLPEKSRAEEVNYKVELSIGKTVETDGANQYVLGMTVKAMPLKGWGYTYYEATGKDVVISTRMAPSLGTPKVKKLVFGRPLLIRYNSRLPVVVYVPEGTSVYYRIFEAPKEQTAASAS
jgi:ecotin